MGEISHISIQIVMITYLLGHDPRILGRKKLKKVIKNLPLFRGVRGEDTESQIWVMVYLFACRVC